MGSIFGSAPQLPPEAPPPPVRTDPSIAERRNELRQAQKKRRGRGATILTEQNQGSLGDAPVERPGSSTLG